jgi:hypothetical protein
MQFAGVGLLVGGALLAAVKLYGERRDKIAKEDDEEEN